MRYGIFTAAILLSAMSAASATENGRWCLSEFGAGEAVNCTFTSLAQCNKSKISNGDMCTLNPRHRSTTGSGASMKK